MEPLPEPPAVAVRPDRPALAVTAPDLSPLAGLPTPSAPIRLRLHIDADGRVNEVVPLEYALADEPFVRRLVEIWLATRHTPARLNGKDVASTKEIVLAANAA
jgi:hypothetical protein